MKIPKPYLLGLGLLMAGYASRAAQDRTWSHIPDLEHQVVLIYDHRQVVDGVELDIVRLNPKAMVAFGLQPLDHQAMLGSNDYMICQIYNQQVGLVTVEGQPSAPHWEFAFRCGGRRYLFAKMDIQ